MVPMTCPSCNRRGNIPRSEANKRLHCKKCNAVFHLDDHDQVHLGEPVDEEAERERQRLRKEKEALAPLEQGFAMYWKTRPRSVKAGVLSVAGVLVTLVLGPALWTRSPLPRTLEGRAEYVAGAFADDAPGWINAITAEGTDSDLRQWMSQARPQLKFQGPQKKYTNEVMSTVAVSIVKEGTAVVVLKMVPPLVEPNPSAANKPLEKLGYDKNGYFDLPTYWVGTSSGWMLDGTTCLKSLSPGFNPSIGTPAPTPNPSSG